MYILGRLKTHIKEHKAATRRGETEKSAIAEHAVGGAKNNTTLFIKEALRIRLTNLELINKDEGVTILGC